MLGGHYTSDNMRVPQKIAEGIYLEMNLSANEALNYAKLVIDKYEGMENECSYKLKPISWKICFYTSDDAEKLRLHNSYDA